MAVSVSAISAKDNESISSDEEDVSLTETDREDLEISEDENNYHFPNSCRSSVGISPAR